jgi:glycosyltransferase involved in cell wall biosynthesis
VISRLDSDKFSPDLFLRVIACLASQFPSVVVKVAGTGELRAEIERGVRDEGLESHVQFLGFVDDVNAVYQWADVIFVPSYTEAMPYTAVEASAFGVECVLPRIGYFAEEDACLPGTHVFDAENAEQAASLILRSLMTQRDPFRKFSQAVKPDDWSRVVTEAYDLEDL